MLSQNYLNTVRSIVIAAITTATIAIQFAHRTSLRLTSESHLPRARCRLSLLALRNIIRTHLLCCFVSGKVCIEEFFTECREGLPSRAQDEFLGYPGLSEQTNKTARAARSTTNKAAPIR